MTLISELVLELFCKVPYLTKQCLVALRCGRPCAGLKLALRQEFSQLEEVQKGTPLLVRYSGRSDAGVTALLGDQAEWERCSDLAVPPEHCLLPLL
ncbi:hypothetical protein MC885_020219 [Smutsia gigantea]|nr:hypothetical protein MC885_020219 [Smutsia gigantea]